MRRISGVLEDGWLVISGGETSLDFVLELREGSLNSASSESVGTVLEMGSFAVCYRIEFGL